MAALLSMSGLLVAQAVPAHDGVQPLKLGFVRPAWPTAPCALPKLGCAFILDTTALSGDVASHVGGGGEIGGEFGTLELSGPSRMGGIPGGGGGGEGGGEGGGGGGGDGEGGGGDGGGDGGEKGEGGGGEGEGGGGRSGGGGGEGGGEEGDCATGAEGGGGGGDVVVTGMVSVMLAW
jgi:hypothetical protein